MVIFTVLAAVLAMPANAPAAGEALAPLRIAWLPATNRNYTPANRPSYLVRTVVIHVTEGSYLGSIQWLRNPRSRASAHYVVSQKGQIAQLVRDADIAWHAGNYQINRSSIGIEHEGYTYRPGTFTDAEYRSSARLSAYIARHYILPINRQRFIGHADVPDPNHPGRRGGFSHHMDPGPYWDWNRYLSYVRGYARGAVRPVFTGPAPKAAPRTIAPKNVTLPKTPKGGLAVATSTIRNGAAVSGFVRWEAKVSGKDVKRVDFLIDGRVRHTEQKAPFLFGDGGLWDTTRETNGVHVLTLRAVGAKGKVAGSSTRVTVENMAFQLSLAGVTNGQSLTGRVRVEALPDGAKADRVEFLVDDRVVRTEREAPYTLEGWDTSKEANGAHTLTVRGVSEDGRVAFASVTVVVANLVREPPRSNRLRIGSQSLRNGQRVSGSVGWTVDVNGDGAERVEFWIDGRLRWTDRTAPIVFNGDGGLWDTRVETNGQHVLTVRVARGSDRVDATITVTVANGMTTAPPSSSDSLSTLSLAVARPSDGATVTGRVDVEATVEGEADRVEFLVDGRLRHTERSAPYEYTWDTSGEEPGNHVLTVKSGAEEESVTVTVKRDAAVEVTALMLADDTRVSGSVHVVATVTGKPAGVEFRVDGRLRHTERSAPYEFDWDTTRETAGTHTLSVKAGESTKDVTVTVPGEPFEVASSSIADGQQLSGSVKWEAVVNGTARRVEFWIDGRRVSVERTAPYVCFGDDALLDTTKLREGAHELRIRAVPQNGAVAELKLSVTVDNP